MGLLSETLKGHADGTCSPGFGREMTAPVSEARAKCFTRASLSPHMVLLL